VLARVLTTLLALSAVGRPTLVTAASDAPTPKRGDACADGADSVYVFDDEGRIQLFEPDGPVEQRFRVIATPECPDTQPQTMALDHRGVAWLLYSSGRLFTIRLPDGACEETTYQHPGMGDVMGMTFTAASSGSKKERLFISDRKGLYEVKLPSLEAVLVDASVPVGELAGGPDGLLFHLDMEHGMLSELDMKSFARRSVHAFGPTRGAFTLLRHRRGFFYFAADPGGPSHIYRWSPRSAETIDLGTAPDGIRVLGRAQSVCVEWSESDGKTVTPASGAGAAAP
jgi:hypothetical protein